MITVTEIFDQAKMLSAQERKELAKLLIDSLDVPSPITPPKTGAEIVAIVQAMEPIEFVAPQIDTQDDFSCIIPYKLRVIVASDPQLI